MSSGTARRAPGAIEDAVRAATTTIDDAARAIVAVGVDCRMAVLPRARA